MKINFHVGSVRLQCVYTAVYNSVWHNRTDLVSLVIGTLLCTDLFQNEINALCCSIWDSIGVKLCSSAFLKNFYSWS